MFRIVLQPEEQALLRMVEGGACLAECLPRHAELCNLVALRMLKCERGYLKLTDLGEAALARMAGRVH
jgi:hypothetical protein